MGGLRRFSERQLATRKRYKTIYYARHRERLLQHKRDWYRANLHRVQIAKKAGRREVRLAALRAYSTEAYPVCACCGELNDGFLTLDHINNDGAAHRRRINADERENGNASGTNFYRVLKRDGYPPGLRVLCFNCNCGRARNSGVCPHDTTATPPMKEAAELPLFAHANCSTH